MKWTISKKLMSSFILICMFLLLVGGVAYYSLVKVNDSYTDVVDRRGTILVQAKDIQISATQLNNSLRDFLLTNNDEALTTINEASKSISILVASNLGLVKLQTHKDLLNKIEELNQQFQKSKSLILSVDHESKLNLATSTLFPLSREIRDLSDRLADEQFNYMNEATDQNAVMVDSVVKTMISLTVVAVIFAMLIGILISRIISKPLVSLSQVAAEITSGDLTVSDIDVKNRDEIKELATSFNLMKQKLRNLISEVGRHSEHVAAASEELSASTVQTNKATEIIASIMEEVTAGAEQQASSVAHSSHSVNEMVKGIQQISHHTQAVATTSFQTVQVAKEGKDSIEIIQEQIGFIDTNVNGLANIISDLDQRSIDIEQIVQVITDIASQTNLLALNAAIEAARAGENGRGFAVVADEVRKLAEQSAGSAQQIARIISHIQGSTHQAVDMMEQVKGEVREGMTLVKKSGTSFSEIQYAVENVSEQIQGVSANSQQLAASVEEVVRSVTVIGDVAKETADGTQNVSAATEEQLASMKEISSSAHSLSKMSEELQNLIRKFKV